MDNVLCFCLLDLISKGCVVDFSTIIQKTKENCIVEYINDLNNDWGLIKMVHVSELNEKIKGFDFDIVEKCGIDSDSNGLIQLLALIINYKNYF